jgi:hypothetical protein
MTFNSRDPTLIMVRIRYLIRYPEFCRYGMNLCFPLEGRLVFGTTCDTVFSASTNWSEEPRQQLPGLLPSHALTVIGPQALRAFVRVERALTQ